MLFQHGGPLAWTWWPPLIGLVAAIGLRHVLAKPERGWFCSATTNHRRLAMYHPVHGSWLKMVVVAHSFWLFAIWLLRAPGVHGVLENAWLDVQRGERDRNTVCQVLEIDPRRHSFSLTPEQQARVSNAIDSVATSATRGGSVITTEPLLVRLRGQARSLYRRDANDFDGVPVLDSMVLAEHPCADVAVSGS